MPGFVVGALIGAVAAAAGAAIAGAAIGTTFVSAFVTGLVLGGVSKALEKKPKPPSLVVSQERLVTVRQPIAPRQVVVGRVRTGGVLTFAHVSSDQQFLHLVITLSGHPLTEIESVLFDDFTLTLDANGEETTRYAGHVRVKKSLGNEGSAQPFPDLVTETNGIWTNNHRQQGCGKLYVRLKANPDLFPTGIPNITAIVKGVAVYDPRTSTTAYSDNAALVLGWYLADSTFGLAADRATEIESSDWIAAANACDETVPLAGGGTEPRYRVGGVFSSDERPRDVIQRLLAAMAGTLVFSGDKWRINAGVYQIPTVTLTESDLRGPIRVQALASRRDGANAVKGVFVSPENAWQPTDFPALVSDTYTLEDGGERVWRDMDLSAFVTSGTQAQRLAKIELLRTRQSLTVELPCKLTAYSVMPGRTVMVTNAKFGWNAKPFEVKGLDLAFSDDGVVGVDLMLREISSSVYDWSTSEEQTIDLAPNTNLPDPFVLGSPTNLTLASGTSHLLALGEGSIISRIFATWDAPGSAFGLVFETQFKKSSESSWTSGPAVRDQTSVYLGPVEDGVAYDVRVRAVNALGVRSSWAIATNHTVVGKSEPPPPPDTFTVTRLADGTRRYEWTMASIPADVRSGGGWRIRYYNGSTSDWNVMTPLHDGLLTNSPLENNSLAAGTYTWAIKTVDSSGNESQSALFTSGTIGDPRLKNVLLQRNEENEIWPGTLTDAYCHVTTNIIYALSFGTMADLPTTISALASTIENIVSNRSPIRYETPVLDLGVDVSFMPLATIVGGGTSTVEMKTGSSADGTVVGNYGPLVFTQGKRYVQFRITQTGTSPSIKQATFLLDSETQIDEFENVNTATETASWFSRIAAGHFRVGSKSGKMASITMAQITALQNVGGAWTWELINKTSTVNGQPAAEFKVRNASGILADATVDVELKGPRR